MPSATKPAVVTSSAQRALLLAAAALIALSSACGHPRSTATEAHRIPAPDLTPRDDGGYAWHLPPGFDPPLVPEHNPMSAAKVELGRRLFFDPRISGDASLSCAGCHRPERAFTDGHAQAVGSTGEQHPRSSMALLNVAYSPSYTWVGDELRRLEDQIRIPLFNEDPIEMGLAGHEQEMLQRLKRDARYPELFRQAFAERGAKALEPGVDEVIDALAAYVRSLVSAESAYDRRVFADDREALSPAAERGMELFFSEELACGTCHGGIAFAGPLRSTREPDTEPQLEHNGLLADPQARFKVPTLRNVALTGPYMHDGRLATLDDVLDHYASGGVPGAGRSEQIRGFALGEEQRRDLLAFLASLTDGNLATDPRFANPFADGMIGG